MKSHQSLSALAALAVLTSAASAAIIQFDISPLSFGDNTTGLSGPNETPSNASSATGNEIGPGISLDNSNGNLTLNFAYGSALGFVDLLGNYSDSHIHKGADNVAGPVIFPIGGLHTPVGPKSGMYAGVIPGLSGAQQADLLANLYYINIHSSIFGGGEIRGQLVQVVPEPGSVMLLLSGAAAVLGLRRRRAQD